MIVLNDNMFLQINKMSLESAPKRPKLTNAMHRTVTTRSSYLRTVMNEVPDEIWLKILGHLSIVDISRVGATCTRLYILSKDPSLWETLHFDIASMSSSLGAVESIIDRGANVKEMRFTNLKNKKFDSMAVVSLIVRARKTMKVLILSCGIELENVAVARLGCLVRLEVLKLVMERISTSGVKAIAKLKNLKEFTIPLSFPSLKDKDLRYLFGELKNLVVVDLCYIEIAKDTFKTLAQNNPSLETVNLPYCCMAGNSSQKPSLKDITENCPNLKHLNLSGWEGIDDDDINSLVQSKKLLHLNFSWCNQTTQMTDNMLLNISKNCSELKYLGLRGLIVKYDFIKALAQNCPFLRHVQIRGFEYLGNIIQKEDFGYGHIVFTND